MKKKQWLPIVLGIFVLILFTGGYVVLKQYNEQQADADSSEAILFSFVDADVTDLQFLDTSGQLLHLSKQDGTWLNVADTEHCTLVEESVQNLLTAINGLVVFKQFENVASLADYGLETPVNTVTLTVAGETYVLDIGNYNTTTSNQYVLLNEDKNIIYAVDTSLIGIFDVDIFDLVVGENFPTLTEDSVKAATLVIGENKTELASELYGSFATFSFNNYVEYYCTDFSKYGLQEPQMVLNITYLVAMDDENNVGEDGITGTVSVEQKLALSIGKKYTDSETGVECYYVRMGNSNEVHSIAVDKIDNLITDKE